ncbi:MAG: DNA polymerase III subunit alpha [Burkholderiales bacterium]|jgi:DNA polymerase-3 subunit alpha|nr:DNA polymerase III subunit alpha [Burkholderiales bacterium]
MNPAFVHLRLHSEYSIVDGIVRVDEAVAAAKADGMPALALTDLSNVFGMVKFYKEARSSGVKPIIGCDLWLTHEADRDNPHRLLLLAQNYAGYLHLCELLTRAYRSNQYRGRAEVMKSWLAETGTEGLIALSGAHHGEVGQALVAGRQDEAKRLAREWAALFPDRYYLEVQRLGHQAMTSGAAAVPVETHVARALQLAAELGLPAVATHPVQFLRPGDFRAHEARVCISEGYILSDQRRPRRFVTEQYFKTQAEMAELFADVPEVLENSVEIARRCTLQLTLGKSRLPHFPTPNEVSLEDYLRQRAGEGLTARLAGLYPDEAERKAQEPAYRERLEFETKTIVQMGFPGYFLIVADFINWAKNNGVPVGPGRGSGAGSLVAYSLGITDLDPLRYNLLFERFLNPERVSMPDFDIDFCQDGRDRVIDYVKSRYGADSVSQIATFGTMAAKAVVRDVGRVLDLGYNFCDQLAKLIPFQPGKHITLEEARKMEPQLAERERNEEEVAELLELAGTLEGLTRNVGMHAGGVLIAPGKLTDFCPLYVADGASAAVSQFDKDDVESIGLVKFDFLGLTTLTILDWTLKYIRRLDPSLDIRLDKLPLDDKAAYDIFAKANTSAVFQFESRGMRDMLKSAKPDRFGDIIALVALYRPGPMELIPEFCARKHGKRFSYPDPRVESILSETYAIMVYQEQVMQMAQIIGGYSLGGADLLRRAMGKKKPEEMAEHRGLFREGAAKNGLDQRKADELFDLMEKFAGYGFNKSHAAAYALVAYQTAYMKAHHPAPFMAANMSAVMNDTDKVQQLVDDARDNGLEVLAPDINSGVYRFEPVDDRRIRYGLGGIKGTGEGAINHIVELREAGGPYRDLFDFCHRVDKRLVNRRVVESLVRAGAFDSVNDNRAELMACVGLALESAEQASRAAAQVSLFGDAVEAPRMVAPANVPRWSKKELLQNEKLALGYYRSDHLFNVYRDEVRRMVSKKLGDLQSAGDLAGRSVTIAGVVLSVRVQNTANGRMGIVTLADDSGKHEVVVYREAFDRFRHKLREDELLLIEVRGRQRYRSAEAEGENGGGNGGDNALRLEALNILDLNEARNRYARGIRLTCNGQSSGSRLKELLGPHRQGNCPVAIDYMSNGARCEVKLGPAWQVNISDDLLRALGEWLRPENVNIDYGNSA